MPPDCIAPGRCWDSIQSLTYFVLPEFSLGLVPFVETGTGRPRIALLLEHPLRQRVVQGVAPCKKLVLKK
jgi:hypothetical protein